MPAFCQIALSTFDLERTERWYCELGFLPAGGRSVGGEQVAALTGLPELEAEVRWLVDRQDFFQLELFRFAKPAPRPLGVPLGRGDAGYVAIGVHVDDGRRGTLRDPDGVLVELLDDDIRGPEQRARPRPDAPAVRRITIGVPDLERAQRFWRDTIGLVEADGLLWGGDVALELVSATGRVRPPEYRISDQGIVNVAIGGPDLAGYEDLLRRTRAGGYLHHAEGRFDGARAVYLEDNQGFSVELLYRSRETSAAAGFEPAS